MSNVSVSNGDGRDVIIALRQRNNAPLLFRGFGPLAAGVVLFLLMLWLAPSVAPEHVVTKPVHTATTTAR
jgi:hypothetical protein